MSQVEPTDLLCRSRREELSADEQRRLNEALQHSLEVRLMSEVLSALESDSRVRPRDEALLARITANALGKPQELPRRRHTFSMLLVAAAVLLVAGLAGAVLGGAQPARAVQALQNFFSDLPREEVAKRVRPRSVQPKTKPMPSNAVQAAPEPVAVQEMVSEIPSAEPVPPPPAAVSQPKAGTAFRSASELFARANLRRRQGHGAEATSLYQLLLEQYPNAREVAPSRLALAKYFQAKQPAQALAQFRQVASAGGALRAEALWGISETATHLGDAAVAEQALADLLREFPESPYAEVARARTTHGLP